MPKGGQNHQAWGMFACGTFLRYTNRGQKYAMLIKDLLQYGTLIESPSSLQEATLVDCRYTLSARELRIGLKGAGHGPQGTATMKKSTHLLRERDPAAVATGRTISESRAPKPHSAINIQCSKEDVYTPNDAHNSGEAQLRPLQNLSVTIPISNTK